MERYLTKSILAKPSIIPGFLPTFSFSILYLTSIILIPLGALILYTHAMTYQQFVDIILQPRVVAAFKISFGIAFLASCISAFFGSIIAWSLSRYQFFGRRFLDAIIDLPFAMPTAVSGITLATLYSTHGWLGKHLEFKVAYTPLGILLALVFVGFPFIVRSLQPAIVELDKDMEEAATCLGATRLQSVRKVIFPELRPALITGFALSFARGLGEYGSVIFIAGNIPYISEIVPLLIVIKLEQFDYLGATAIAVTMLIASFLLLFTINLIQLALKEKK